MQHDSKLQVWQRSHNLVLGLYRASQTFSPAALSVPTKIAEASLSETEYLLVVSRDLGFLTLETAHLHLAETEAILKMLHGLQKKVQAGI